MINTKDLIGRNKYAVLKRFDFNKMSTEQMVQFRKQHKISVAQAEKMIEDYENHRVKPLTEKQIEAKKDYLRKLKKTESVKEAKITIELLWEIFYKVFKKQEGKKLKKTEDVLENIKPLFYYFLDDLEKFKNCSRVSNLSVPSLEKGILVVGDFGNGKSTTLRVFEKCLRNTSKYFKGYSANEIVLEFEGCVTPADKTGLIKKMSTGTLYFDDIKSERMANNYGKNEIFREILENRYNNKAKTFITCNYKKGFEGNLQIALDEFGEKYGDRVNDRIYEMFNIIEFKGKSFRK